MGLPEPSDAEPAAQRAEGRREVIALLDLTLRGQLADESRQGAPALRMPSPRVCRIFLFHSGASAGGAPAPRQPAARTSALPRRERVALSGIAGLEARLEKPYALGRRAV